MYLKRNEWAVLAANLAYVLPFGLLSIRRLNYEFMIYGLVIILAMALVMLYQRRVEFGPLILWGLTCWGFLHMAGGHIFIGSRRLAGSDSPLAFGQQGHDPPLSGVSVGCWGRQILVGSRGRHQTDCLTGAIGATALRRSHCKT